MARKPSSKEETEPRLAGVLAFQFRLEAGTSPTESATRLQGLMGAMPKHGAYPLPNGFVVIVEPLAVLQTLLSITESLGEARLAVAVGVHVGPAMELTSGPKLKTATGAGVETAIILADHARPGETLISESASLLLEASAGLDAEFRSHEPVRPSSGEAIPVREMSFGSAEPTPELEKLETFLPQARRLLHRAAKRANQGGYREMASEEVVARRLLELRKDLVGAFLLIAVALGLHYWAGQSELGQKLDLWAYEKLQGQMTSARGGPNVVVVDIRDDFDAPVTGATDMHKLHDLITKLASQHPVAIGLDIDFGMLGPKDVPAQFAGNPYPDAESVVTPLAASLTAAGTPVYLAVHRGLSQPSDMWLGNEAFKPLAVHAERPPDAATGQMFLLGDLTVAGQTIPSLGEALAGQYARVHPRAGLNPLIASPYPESLETWSATLPNSSPGGHPLTITGKQYLLNTSALNQLRQTTLRDQDLANPDRLATVAGKMVVIGDTAVASDVWYLPTSQDKVPGVYYHALAADTLADSPAYVLTPSVRWLLNLASAALILLTLRLLRTLTITELDVIDESKLGVILIVALMAGAIAGGTLLVRAYNILWTDYFLVSLLLLLHPRIEHTLKHGPKKLQQSLAKGWRSFAFMRDR